MYKFISWKEMSHLWKPDVERRIYFLTGEDLASKRGQELKKYLGRQYANVKVGHGVIDWFFQLEGKGTDIQCTDFSTPKKFPLEIVTAIKNGEFEGVSIAEGILTKKALADYQAKRDTLLADYWADYRAKVAPLRYVFADYWAKRDTLDADYRAKVDTLFWQIAKDPKNRRKEWR